MLGGLPRPVNESGGGCARGCLAQSDDLSNRRLERATVVPNGSYIFHHSPKLTDKDSILLADFANTTGDPVFDGTLRQGLSVQLGQRACVTSASSILRAYAYNRVHRRLIRLFLWGWLP
jgi:hypothetical protein